MRKMSDPDYTYRPWPEERCKAASVKAKALYASRPLDQKLADVRRKIDVRQHRRRQAVERLQVIDRELFTLFAEQEKLMREAARLVRRKRREKT